MVETRLYVSRATARQWRALLTVTGELSGGEWLVRSEPVAPGWTEERSPARSSPGRRILASAACAAPWAAGHSSCKARPPRAVPLAWTPAFPRCSAHRLRPALSLVCHRVRVAVKLHWRQCSLLHCCTFRP